MENPVIDPNNQYTRMQQDQYDRDAAHWSVDNRDPVVGSFDQHNAWQDYDDFLFKGVSSMAGKTALEFGCGPGRNMVRFNGRFRQIDGVDISEGNLKNAEIWCRQNGVERMPALFKNNGVDISAVDDAAYDVVFSTICMQHIPVYDVRFGLLKEFYRVLKTGGQLCFQMGFDNWVRKGFSAYHANTLEAHGTNGIHDVCITDVDQVRQDLEKIGFTGFDHDMRPVGPGDQHHNWLFVRATKPAA